MMLARKLTKIYSIEEYLKLEERSKLKHEFHYGELYAMAGGTVDHSTLAGNILSELKIALRGKKTPCRVHTSDMKIYIQDNQTKEHFVYPDVSVTCDSEDHQNRDRIEHPKVIIEVLSKSTELYDRTEKFELYKNLKSLMNYVLVNYKHERIEIFSRLPKSHLWTIEVFNQGKFSISSINFECSIETIYEGVIGINNKI